MRRFLSRLWFLPLVLGFLAAPGPRAVEAAITITGYAYGSEGPALAGATIENFEDVNLIPGLTIRMGGIPGYPARMWSGTLPRIWVASTASSCCTLGGPFPNNPWDGVAALCNGGLGGTGLSGLAPGTGNYWDFTFADSVYFLLDTPQAMFGVGLSNFQSALSGDPPRTDHELIVNGVSRGTVESLLPGFVSGQYIRNRYLVITATAPDNIRSVAIQNVSTVNADGLVFDKLAIRDFTSPAQASTWGSIKATYR
jgi:hypothetical protein